MDKANRKLCFASVISEIKQSPIFLTVKARLFETPRANLNGARVTPAFLEEIIENQEKYVGLSLNADVKALVNGQFDRLGHLYNARTGEFHSTQIGSFYKFEKEDFDEGTYLVGYARIPKSKKAICKAIGELFADGSLKFSFEITCGSYEELDDGTIRIDASDENFLEGMAIVSFPACEDATALELVAEVTDTNGKGDAEMTDVKETMDEKTMVAEAETSEEVNAEDLDASCKEEKAAACSTKEEACKEEVATVYVTEEHVETVSTSVYDTETDTSVNERVVVEKSVTTHEDCPVCAEEIVAEGDGDPVEEPGGETPSNNVPGSETPGAEEPGSEPGSNSGDAGSSGSESNSGNSDSGNNDAGSGEESAEADPAEGANTDACENKKTAEQMQAMITELVETVKALKAEIAEMKEVRKEAASVKKDNETMNPFIAEITTNGNTKYSLLKSVKEDKPSYGLLNRAF